MNSKLIMVWVIGIVLFVGLFVFGFVNRDLLTNSKVDEFTPIKNKQTTHTCTKNLEDGISTYTFFLDENDQVNKVNVKFISTSVNEKKYSSSTTLNNLNIKGITTSLNGLSNNFTFTMNVDLLNYDKVTLGTMSNELIDLSIVINNINDYETYKLALNNLDVNSTYNCT